MIERERRWLVRARPGGLAEGTRIRQGYITVADDRSVRLREKGAALVLTVKGGTGRARTEVELNLDREQFDELWPLTEGRRLVKVRHELPVAGRTAELDVFQGTLAGLELVEVEFDDDTQATAFTSPEWFGEEVTDDPRYTNAALAQRGPPT